MSQLNDAQADAAASYIYYDLVVSNQQSDTVAPQVFQFNEVRTSPFVDKPEDYELSIQRFTIDTGTLPVFIPTIQGDAASADETIYSVTLAAYDSTGQAHVTWEPQDKTTPEPPLPSATHNGQQLNSTGYYNCYSYSWWCYLVYKASIAAKADLVANSTGKTLVNANGDGFNSIDVNPPVFAWEVASNKATIWAETQYFSESLDAFGNRVRPSVEIFMNTSLFSLFGSFPFVLETYTAVDGMNVRIPVADLGKINEYTTPADWLATVVQQEWSTMEAMTPITSIVFTSNQLPIEPNQVSNPIVYLENKVLGRTSVNSATANIITDLVSNSGLYKPNLVYVPSAQFRMITLYGNRKLYNLDLNIEYRLRNGELVPFRLGSGGTVTMKIAFIKKKRKSWF